MENRISRLEENFTALSRDVSSLSADVKTIGGIITKIADNLDVLKLSSERNKPLSYGAILTSVIGTGTIFAMVTSGISFLIDARVGSATQRSNTFVSEMTDGGRIFVQLERLGMRVERIEQAIQWSPRFATTIEPSKR